MNDDTARQVIRAVEGLLDLSEKEGQAMESMKSVITLLAGKVKELEEERDIHRCLVIEVMKRIGYTEADCLKAVERACKYAEFARKYESGEMPDEVTKAVDEAISDMMRGDNNVN